MSAANQIVHIWVPGLSLCGFLIRSAINASHGRYTSLSVKCSVYKATLMLYDRLSLNGCETAKCIINWACRRPLWLWSTVAGPRRCYDCGYLVSWKLTVHYWQPDLSGFSASMNSSHIVKIKHGVWVHLKEKQSFKDTGNTNPGFSSKILWLKTGLFYLVNWCQAQKNHGMNLKEEIKLGRR